MNRNELFRWFSGVLIAGASLHVYAHEELEGGVGFLAGLLHPALGLDHLLAMLSVGVISAQIGGKAIWTVPGAFVCFMVVGGMLGMRIAGMPFVETGIALSVLLLGVALLLDRVGAVWIVLGCVAFFGTFHGYAHGVEMPVIANPFLYSAGFVLGTALIHLSGVGIGFLSRTVNHGAQILRASGGLIALAGLAFLVS